MYLKFRRGRCARLAPPGLTRFCDAEPDRAAPGATVSSRPTFAIADTTSDIVLLTVAMSRYPDVKTAGDDTGAFVSIDAFETWSIPDDLVDGLARWPANERLEAAPGTGTPT